IMAQTGLRHGCAMRLSLWRGMTARPLIGVHAQSLSVFTLFLIVEGAMVEEPVLDPFLDDLAGLRLVPIDVLCDDAPCCAIGGLRVIAVECTARKALIH